MYHRPRRVALKFDAISLPGALLMALCFTTHSRADDKPSDVKADEVLAAVRTFFQKTALPDGSFRPGIDPAYQGYSDTEYSDLAAITYASSCTKPSVGNCRTMLRRGNCCYRGSRTMGRL